MPPEFSDHEKEKIERLRRAMYSRSLSGKLKDRPRRELGMPGMAVGEDFSERQGQVAGMVVAPRAIGFARTVLWWLLGIAVLFFIAAVAFFAYYFLFGGGSLAAPPSNIDIVVSGPPQIEGGSPAELQIAVTNRNKVPLELADLVVTFPPGTRSPTDFSTDEPSLRVSLGTIGPGETRQGTVPAVFAGSGGEQADVKIELEYHISGSSAIFVASSDYTLTFSSSALSLAIGGNTQTISGQPVELTVNVSSNASAPVKDVLLNAAYPFGFTLTSAAVNDSSVNPKPTIAPDGASSVWQLGDIEPGQTRTVTIQGSLTGEEGDNRVFHFTAGTRNEATSTSIDTPLADNTFSMSISQPFLGLAITANGASGDGVIVSPLDTVNVSIAWQNNLQTAITNAVIVAQLSGIQIDGSTVKSPDGFYRSSDDVVLWDKTTTGGALANLAPGAHGTVSFSFQMPSSDALKSLVNPRLDISINAAGDRVSEAGVPENLQATANQQIALASDLELTARGLYYSNQFGSSGPMPPKAGAETTYALVFNITNTSNKISGAQVTAHLPPYVRWVGLCSPSSTCLTDLAFNQDDGTVTWNVGDIAPGTGLNGTPPQQISFEIGLTPSTSQIGQQPALLQNISFSGTDAATNASITRSVADVTTDILGDPGFLASSATVVSATQ
jgi:hypothetical protein